MSEHHSRSETSDRPPLYWIVGRMAKELARLHGDNTMVELPPVGALVVESSHSWRHRGLAWPQPDGVGWVERVEAEDESRPLSKTNVRVVIRRLDDDTLQPWVNAGFIIIPTLMIEHGRWADA